jgi:GTP-binding protein
MLTDGTVLDKGMIVKSAEFVTSAVKPSQYPPAELAEFAFAGRSNVGKSSMINTLVNRRRLVKTSNTPGRTQLINFFRVNGNLSFVDLPGYGYAKVPPKIRAAWGPMVETYLSVRPCLRGVILIVDIRRIPGAEELRFLCWLERYRLPAVLAVTKTDKLSKNQQMRQRTAIAQVLSMPPERLIFFSSKSRTGVEAVWNAIDGLVDQDLHR